MNNNKLSKSWDCTVRSIKASLIIVAGGIAGCSGGGGGSSSSESTVEPIQSVDDGGTVSTALSEHQASQTFSFGLYRSVELVIDLNQYASQIEADYYVVKLSDLDSNTIYLAVHQPQDEVQLRFSAPYSQRSAWLEVYTELSDQGFVLEEIPL